MIDLMGGKSNVPECLHWDKTLIQYSMTPLSPVSKNRATREKNYRDS